MAFQYAVVLTGGIASGKSSVAVLFALDGFDLIDADKVAHDMLELHQEKIAQLFGSEYINEGKVDRKALGALIFSNPEEKKRLEALMHPLIFEEIKRQSEEKDLLKRPYIIDIPLFFETKRYPIKESIVVYTPKEKQLERLMKRDDSTKEEAEQRINAQMSIEEKKQAATYLIDNSKDLKFLQDEYAKVKNKILDNYIKD
ncbi:dephospho-CoA kinase [bacterium]|nr:dephospho-CoA kinase [bacterium]MBU1959132.1 dephospho-CoA kinase [bacterium]